MGPHASSNGKEEEERSLEEALAAARPFLRGELEQVDPDLPRLVSVLRAAGAGECWHKHGTFLAHLVDVYRILHLGRAPEAVVRCGLYHSSYSNSYVNLAIFQPDTGRGHVRAIIGAEAERLVHLFCVVPRQQLIHDHLLFHYTDQELVDDLLQSSSSLPSHDEQEQKQEQAADEPSWRLKIQRLIPVDGITVKHIRTGEDVKMPRRVAAAFLLMTMADFSDQLFDWQDRLFRNTDGRLEFRGDNWRALWPGTGKPGLWVASISRMGALYSLIARDEEIIARSGRGKQQGDDDEDLRLIIPPVFDGCTKVLDAGDQIAARDLYWEAITSGDDDPQVQAKVENLLKQSIAKNPFVGEAHLGAGAGVPQHAALRGGAGAGGARPQAPARLGIQLGQEDVVGRMGFLGQSNAQQGPRKGLATYLLRHDKPRPGQVIHP